MHEKGKGKLRTEDGLLFALHVHDGFGEGPAESAGTALSIGAPRVDRRLCHICEGFCVRNNRGETLRIPLNLRMVG